MVSSTLKFSLSRKNEFIFYVSRIIFSEQLSYFLVEPLSTHDSEVSLSTMHWFLASPHLEIHPEIVRMIWVFPILRFTFFECGSLSETIWHHAAARPSSRRCMRDHGGCSRQEHNETTQKSSLCVRFARETGKTDGKNDSMVLKLGRIDFIGYDD